jgi:two-component system alkaline phosphatase synthesis response regulator PhoP
MQKKILLIEDEKILQEMYKERFRRAGFRVLLAIDSDRGLKLAKKEIPDLVILDILLPGENGISFLKKLRKNPKTAKIKVVALSNFNDPSIRKEAKELGAIEYLIKTDYTPGQLIKKIKNIL